MLGVFNLIPIPPLDGSRLLFALLPQTDTTFRVMYFLERWGMIVVLAFVVFGFQIVVPFIKFLFVLFTGQALGI
jgi:Zn-dependent protease